MGTAPEFRGHFVTFPPFGYTRVVPLPPNGPKTSPPAGEPAKNSVQANHGQMFAAVRAPVVIAAVVTMATYVAIADIHP